MTTQKINCEQAKKIDIASYLEQLNYKPSKVRGNDYWYYSPFHKENTPSFKINRKLNLWYDHSLGKGGNLVDFGIAYHECTVADFLERLNKQQHHFSFHPQQTSAHLADEKKVPDESRISILNIRAIRSNMLLDYLEARKIPPEIAQRYCKEVDFSLYGKRRTAIGFENQLGGFELRSPTFKGSFSPKGITFFDNYKKELYVFEGFFDFLSFATIRPQSKVSLTNSLVLNSLSFFEKSRSIMERHHKVFLFLDRGISGRQNTLKGLEWNKEMGSEKYIDSNELYKFHDDLNEWLVAQSKQKVEQRIERGRGI